MRGMARERNRRLRDVVARLGLDLFAERLNLVLGRLRANQHAVAAGFVRGLDDEFFHVFQNVFFVGFFVREVGVHVRNDRILIEVIFDHLGHEIIHHLVVGDAGADGVGQRDVAGAISVHQAGHAEHRITAEHRRINKIIIHAAINHMHRLQAFRRAHEHPRVAHQQVAALDNFNAHLPREIRVLEIRRVVGARREQHHRRIGHAGGRDVMQHPQQFARIILHRPHADAFEHLRKRALHRAPVFQHVAHAARTTAIVFQHEIIAFVIADQIRAANVDVNILRHVEVHELAPEMFSRQNVKRRDDAVLQNFLLVIKIVQKQIQRRDALRPGRAPDIPIPSPG